MRAFVAIALPGKLRKQLLELIDGLPATRDVRWCSDEQLHITLKFLGDVPEARVPAVREAVRNTAAGAAPFEVTLGGLGAFPPQRSPRVLWVGVDDPRQGCAAWLAAAEPELEVLGFPPERRAFHPHVTLGRSKSAAGGRYLQQVLDAPPTPVASRLKVAEITLYESMLGPGGARYRVVERAPLGGG